MKTAELNRNILNIFESDVLKAEEMRKIVGGSKPRPHTKDKDVFDIDDDEDSSK